MLTLSRRRALGFLFTASSLTAFGFTFGADLLHAATCTGAAPCNACKNCSSCAHCAKRGGKCGVCKRKPDALQRHPVKSTD